MDFVKGIIGLAVLSSPLWLMMIVVPVSILTALVVARRFKKLGVRIAAGSIVLLAFVLLLFGDEIAGRMYLSHLCATEAGVRVYQRAELPLGQWDEDGRPRYIARNGFVDMKLLPGKYKWHKIEEPFVTSVIRIRKWRWQLIDTETNVVLGEKITFMRDYGWLNRLSVAPNIGESCAYLGQDKEREREQELFSNIFIPSTSVHQE